MKPLAEQTDFIRQRMEENIEDRRRAILAACDACGSTGWELDNAAWIHCKACKNPLNRTREPSP